MGQQVVCPAINRLGRHDMLACLRQSLERVADGRRPAGHRQCRHATLQGRDAPLEHVLCRVRQPPVNVPRVPQSKTVGRMLRVMKHIRRRRINRNRPRIRHRIRLLLPDMQLPRLESPVLRIPDINSLVNFMIICHFFILHLLCPFCIHTNMVGLKCPIR